MKLFALLLFISISSYAALPAQPEVRSLFQKAATGENACRLLVKMLTPYNEINNPLLGGYKACATMMMAKYVLNPFTKLSYFLKGRSLLEKCIAADEHNIELKFLRYTIQKKAPFFLNYRSSVNEDKRIITAGVPGIKDAGLKKMILDFLRSEKS